MIAIAQQPGACCSRALASSRPTPALKKKKQARRAQGAHARSRNGNVSFALRRAEKHVGGLGARERRRRENLTGEGTGTCKRQVMGGWMGVGRASEQNTTYLTTFGSMLSVDVDRAPPTRRRPVRVRRRRSQRRAERGERSEGCKCDGSIGSAVRMAPLSQVGSGRERPQTSAPIDRFSLRPSLATQRETSPPAREGAMVGVLFSRWGEGWLWVSQESSRFRGDPPGMAPTHRQRDGAPQKPLGPKIFYVTLTRFR